MRPDASKAWQLVENNYDNTPDLGSDMEKPIHVAIGNLCLKAYGAREIALLSSKMCCPPTPEFIGSLRRHREATIAIRSARHERSQLRSRPSIPSVSLGLVAAIDQPDGPQGASFARQSTTSNPSNLFQASESAEVDPFHLFDNFENNQANEFMDLDFSLLDDYNMDDFAPDKIDWEQ